jgi:hypothetical protein
MLAQPEPEGGKQRARWTEKVLKKEDLEKSIPGRQQLDSKSVLS